MNAHTPSWKAESSWLTPSLSAARAALSTPKDGGCSEDALVLILLLSRMAIAEPIPVSLLSRGAAPRKRWTETGDIGEVNATSMGLDLELARFLCDAERLQRAFLALSSQTAIKRLEDDLYTTNEDAVRCLDEELPHDTLTFWQEQALIIVYRSIPWRYLEPIDIDTPFYLPHLNHALHAYSSGSIHLSAPSKTDLALTLAEAARFPGMPWKRFVLAQAESVRLSIEEQPVCLKMGILLNRCILDRVSGDMKQAAHSLDAIAALAAAGNAGAGQNQADARAHASTGLACVQKALNDIQIECLNTAEQCLRSWTPRNPQQPSPLEQAVMFRQAMIQGRLLRFRGSFAESHTCLDTLIHRSNAGNDSDGLVWDEELRDLTCDLADTLRELGRMDEAEMHLHTEITRRQKSAYRRNSDRNEDGAGVESAVRKRKAEAAETKEIAFLDLALAETRFARGALRDAYEMCVRVLSRPRLRFCTLRAHIILAKTQHVWGDHQLAAHHWTEALKAISTFTLTNGYTTQAILASARDNMRHLAQEELEAQSDEQLASLRLQAVPEGGMQHWIAGMQQWYQEHGAAAVSTAT